MRCLVTGGNGFIGSYVTKALRNAKHEVKVLDINPEADYQVNICNTAQVREAVRDADPEIVFHIAAVADARAALQDPIKVVDVNIKGTVSMFKAAHEVGVKRVVLASTCWVANAMCAGILDELTSFLPAGGGHIYTTTKIACEMLANDFYTLYGLNFTILRYGIPYGPGIWPGLVLRNWMDRAKAGEPLVIYGDGSASRRFLYISDLAEAHVLALKDVATNQTYNLEGMRQVTIKELADTFCRVWGNVEIEYRPEPTRVGEFQYLRKIISNAKAFAELGWGPSIDLENGIRQTVSWYRSDVVGACDTNSAVA